MASKLQIRVLGQFSVRIDGKDLANSAISGRKARSLLKLLALQRNYQIVRDQATDLLWPSLSPESASSQLYKAIHHIRKAFSAVGGSTSSDELIDITDELICLQGTVVTDAKQFEEASRKALASTLISDFESAASLYSGDLLPMDLYSDWTAVPRDHLRQLYLDVLLALGEEYERRNHLAHAAETFRLALQKDPLLETAHRCMMRIFALQGQTTRAARQYESCRQVLTQELQTEPEAETVRLYQAIQEKRISGTAVAAEPVDPLALPALVDRTEECRRIEAIFGRLAAGRNAVLMIEGSVGVGKTRLAQELTARSRRRGFTVLSGRAREMEGSVAYGPFIEIIDAAVRENADAQHLLPQEIARSIPTHSGSAQSVPNTDRKAAQGYMFAQILQFLRQFADSAPVVLLIEDLHAADEGTLELFQYLSRKTADLPLLLAATVRSDLGEQTERIRRRHAAISSESTLSVLALDPLEEPDHTLLLEQVSDSRELAHNLAESVYRLSEGNPLFAIELYRFHGENGTIKDISEDSAGLESPGESTVPPSLSSTVNRQLDNLSPGARHLLYLMAVLGRDLGFDLLEAAWNGGEASGRREMNQSLFDLLDELRAARLVEEHGLEFRFRHALVRASIYQSVSEARRIALHTLAARSLLALFPGEEEAPVEQIAFHFKRAGDARQAAHYLTLAAQRAESVYAHEDAIRCLQDALDVLRNEDDSVVRRTRSRLLRQIGDVYRASGRMEQSYESYEQALDLAKNLHLSRSERAELHLNIALVAIFRTEMDKSQRHLDAALELVETDDSGRARALILKALHLWHLNKLEEAYHTAQQALETAESIGASLLASQACEILAMTCLPMGRWEEGLDYEKRRQVHGWSPDVVVATDAHLCLWEYHVSGDRPLQEASNFMGQVSEQAARLGDYRCVAVCHYALGTMHLWRGDNEKANEQLDASLELHERVGSPAGMAYALARKAVMHTVHGALDLGWEAVTEGIEHANLAAVRDHCLQRLYGIGIWNRLEANEAIEAGNLIRASEALLQESQPCPACALELYPWLSFYYLGSGDVEKARDCSQSVNALAEATGNPIASVVSNMVMSSVLAARDDHDAANDLREKALTLVDRTVGQQVQSPITHFLDRMIDQQVLKH